MLVTTAAWCAWPKYKCELIIVMNKDFGSGIAVHLGLQIIPSSQTGDTE